MSTKRHCDVCGEICEHWAGMSAPTGTPSVRVETSGFRTAGVRTLDICMKCWMKGVENEPILKLFTKDPKELRDG